MNRKYTAAGYLGRIEAIRKLLPDAGISGDMMVGFPGETEDDFSDTLKLTRNVRYANLFTFIYSRRKGTAADLMDGQIDEKIKVGRITRLIDLQTEIGHALAKDAIGKSFEVLCDTYDQKTGESHGKTSSGKAVTFQTDGDKTGQFITVEVTGSKNTNLYGKPAETKEVN